MLNLARSVIACLALMSASAFAQDVQECNYEGSQREMNACAIAEYKETFADYVKVYQETWRAATPEARKRLESSTNYWTAAVRKQCQRASKDSGGDETILFYACLQQVINYRVNTLKRGG